MKIFYDGKEVDIEVNDNSYRYRAIKGEHNLTLYYSLPKHLELPLGAYCMYDNEKYTLETPENFKMHNSHNFEYTVVMESEQAKLKKYRFREVVYSPDTDTWGGKGRLKFSITAKPQEHLRMLVDNLNQRDGGWVMGEYVDSVEKLISYNHTSCDAALSQMADAFETEWEVIGKTIHLRKVEGDKKSALNNGYDTNGNPIPLSYGLGKGFKPGVGRTNFSESKPLGVLYVQGGDRNIDVNEYGTKELLLPKGQTLRYDGKYFEDQEGFDEALAHSYVSSDDGLSIRRAADQIRSQEEGSLDLSHIYPNWEHTVTAIGKDNLGDIFAENTAEYPNNSPDDIDYNKCRLGAEKATVIFQSGMLVGREFDIVQTDKALTGYDHATKKFELISIEADWQTMPNDKFTPRVGDKFRVFGTLLPKGYICNDDKKLGASWQMYRQAVKYLYENEEQKFTFTGELDGIWLKDDWQDVVGKIKLGEYVLFGDEQFQPEGIGIRIVGIKDFINNPYSPEIELSNQVVGSSIMSNIRKIESNEVLADSKHNEALQFTKRRFRDAQESTKMLENALLDFTGSVNPVTVKTMQLLLGDASLQYQFVESRTNPQPVNFQVTYNDGSKKLSAPAGTLQHLTMGIDLMSPSQEPSDYRFWDINALTQHDDLDVSASYYIYIKVSKNGPEGYIMPSKTALELDGNIDYYTLLYGTLSAEFEGVRSLVSWYGYSELTPGRFIVPKIVSPDGKTYFDVAKGEIGGNIVFVDKAGKKKTLIEGGKITNDALNTDELIARKVAVTNPETLDDVIINPTEGMTIYNNNQKQTTFSGGNIADLSTEIPKSDNNNIIISEAVFDFNPKTKSITLASGTLSVPSTPVNVEFPKLRVSVTTYNIVLRTTQWHYWEDEYLNLDFMLNGTLYGLVAAGISRNDFTKTAVDTYTYIGRTEIQTIEPSIRTYNASTKIDFTVDCYKTAYMPDMPVEIRFGDFSGPMKTQNLRISGAAKIGSNYYGNGSVITKDALHYSGTTVNTNAVQQEVRSGEVGYKFDNNGLQLMANNVWNDKTPKPRGFVRYPDGIMIQWDTISNRSGFGTFEFPMAFLGKPLSLIATMQTPMDRASNNVVSFDFTRLTATSVPYKKTYVSSSEYGESWDNFNYIAIGKWRD